MMQEFVDQINKSARSATEDMHCLLYTSDAADE